MGRLPEALEAGPLILRRWREEHVEEVLEAVTESLAELRLWLPWAQEVPAAATQREFLSEAAAKFDAGTEYHYGAYERDGGMFVGGCGLHGRHGPDVMEMGYWVRTSRGRRGYGTSMAEAVTRATFRHLAHIHTIEIHCDVTNVASAGIPRKLGYVHDRTVPREPVGTGETGRSMVWVMTRDRFQEREREVTR